MTVVALFIVLDMVTPCATSASRFNGILVALLPGPGGRGARADLEVDPVDEAALARRMSSLDGCPFDGRSISQPGAPCFGVKPMELKTVKHIAPGQSHPSGMSLCLRFRSVGDVISSASAVCADFPLIARFSYASFLDTTDIQNNRNNKNNNNLLAKPNAVVANVQICTFLDVPHSAVELLPLLDEGNPGWELTFHYTFLHGHHDIKKITPNFSV